jgi:hypothetical protein
MNDLKEYLAVYAYRARIQQEYRKNMANLLLLLFLFYYANETCKGRDKICSFIEYTSDFYYHCLKYSGIQ